MAEDSNEFYWVTFFIKVEDKLFCVPRYEFVKSSEVFADMFLLPSGPATRSEGQDRDHPIVLEGYKKDEFTSLLKVMYPTSSSLISGKNVELPLEKEEWVGVLKLSTIWDMTKIRQYAIHRLSNLTLSPIEKILLARAHRVGPWLDEAVTILTTCNPMPTFEDLATLGWETVARILWIRDNLSKSTSSPASSLSNSDTLRFRRDAIKCPQCSSSSSLINDSYGCGHIASGDAMLTVRSSSTSLISGTFDRCVKLRLIQCPICDSSPFNSVHDVHCYFCSFAYSNSYQPNVRVTLNNSKSLKTNIEEMFGEEIKEYEPSLPLPVADLIF